jgi:hypothetical protein
MAPWVPVHDAGAAPDQFKITDAQPANLAGEADSAPMVAVKRQARLLDR